MPRNTIMLAFVTRWIQRFYPNAVIVRETDEGIELTRHNGQLGLAYREVGEPLVLRHESVHGRHDFERWARFTAHRIDLWAQGEPDPDSPDEWYAAELARLKDRAPA